jgi:hypothetical protein
MTIPIPSDVTIIRHDPILRQLIDLSDHPEGHTIVLRFIRMEERRYLTIDAPGLPFPLIISAEEAGWNEAQITLEGARPVSTVINLRIDALKTDRDR